MSVEADSTLQSGKIKINGVELYYTKRGNGQPILLCMPGSLGSGLGDFKYNFNVLSERMTVVTFDPRGYGNSRPPRRRFPTNFYNIDAEDSAELMAHLGYDKYCVMGWSDGGISGIIHAGTKTENVEKFIVLNASAYFDKLDCEILLALRDINKWNPKTLDALSTTYGLELLKEMNNEYIDTTVAIYNGGGNICKSEAEKITCPTLIIHGSQDPMVPSFHANYLKDHIKNSQLCMVPNGKHAIHKRYPEKINRLVKKFLLEDTVLQWEEI